MVDDFLVGDFVLVQTDHFASKLIRFGQRRYGKDAAQWNHAALYVGEVYGIHSIVEALTSGVVLSRLDKYPSDKIKIIRTSSRTRAWWRHEPQGQSDLDMRASASRFALNCVGEKYGWMTIASIAVKVLTKGRIDFGIQGTTICSGLVARSLERMGYDFKPWDPAELTPAYLARIHSCP